MSHRILEDRSLPLALVAMRSCPLLMELQKIADQSCWTARGSFLTAGQKGLCTSIVLARTSRKFFSQFTFWLSYHSAWNMSCLVFWFSQVDFERKSLAKTEVSKYFPLSFMRCWCYLPVPAYWGTVFLWTLMSATADSLCQKPKSLWIISHMRQACTWLCSSWKPSACCCFHNHKTEAVLSEPQSQFHVSLLQPPEQYLNDIIR